MKGRPSAAQGASGKPPSLPYWFTYVAFVISTLWMLICGYFVILYGLLFEANSCTFKVRINAMISACNASDTANHTAAAAAAAATIQYSHTNQNLF